MSASHYVIVRIAVILLLFFGPAIAEVISFSHEVLEENKALLRRVFIYSKQDLGLSIDPVVTYELNALSKTSNVDAKAYFVVFPAHEDTVLVCPSLSYPGEPKMAEFPFIKGRASLSGKVQINQTGAYFVGPVSCSPDIGQITVSGSISVLNPGGYIPAELYGNLKFYLVLSILYLLVLAMWLGLNAYYWSQVMNIQHAITVVLCICCAEMLFTYFNYSSWNKNGNQISGIFFIALLFNLVRSTLSRMLVTAVSMGLGVSKPALEKNQRNRILGLGALYFMLSGALEIIAQGEQHRQDRSDPLVLTLNLGVACVDGLFYSWIFVALSRTLVELRENHQLAKLTLYKHFTRVLIVSLATAVFFAIYSIYFMAQGVWLEQWNRIWLMENGFWNILYGAVLLAIIYLWRPSTRSKQYAFSSQLSSDEAEAEAGEESEADDVELVGDGAGDGNDGEEDDDEEPADTKQKQTKIQMGEDEP